MSGAQDAIRLVPEFKNYLEIWQGLNRQINTLDDLFLCYYSSLTVIRIPKKDHLMLVNTQVHKLHQEITRRCQEGFEAKVKARMSSNADELQIYLTAGFEHFTTTLDRPFNFIEVALFIFALDRFPLTVDNGLLCNDTILRGIDLNNFKFNSSHPPANSKKISLPNRPISFEEVGFKIDVKE